MSSSLDEFLLDELSEYYYNSSQESGIFRPKLSPTRIEELEMSISNPPSNTTENLASPEAFPTSNYSNGSSIKLGLKEKIKQKRPDLKSEPFEFENEKPEELVSPEVLARIEERRKRNCLAARKCRNKRKNEIAILNKKIRELQVENRALSKENKRLKQELLSSKNYLPSIPCHEINYSMSMSPHYGQSAMYSENVLPNDLQSVHVQPMPCTSQGSQDKGYLSSLMSDDFYDFPV